MIVNDLKLSAPFIVHDIRSGKDIFSIMDTDGPGDIPPDIAALRVVGKFRTVNRFTGIFTTTILTEVY